MKIQTIHYLKTFYFIRKKLWKLQPNENLLKLPFKVRICIINFLVL
jgi:hypothetical protein